MSYNTYNNNNTTPIVLEKNGNLIQYNFCTKCIEWIKCKSNRKHEEAKQYVHSVKYCKLLHYFKIDHDNKGLCGFILNGKLCPDGDACTMNHAMNYPKISLKDNKFKNRNEICFAHAKHIIDYKNPCIFGEKCSLNHNFTEKLVTSNYCINYLFRGCDNKCKRYHCSNDELKNLKLTFENSETIKINNTNDTDFLSITNILSFIDIPLYNKDEYEFNQSILYNSY